jgi:hypothetical protein
MAFLDMGQMVTANSTALSWQPSTNPPFDVTNYKPTMALAQNHIHFLGVPNSQPGTAQIFVIHCELLLLRLGGLDIYLVVRQSRSSSLLHKVIPCLVVATPSPLLMGRLLRSS